VIVDHVRVPKRITAGRAETGEKKETTTRCGVRVGITGKLLDQLTFGLFGNAQCIEPLGVDMPFNAMGYEIARTVSG
jgi:hypothetical protein